MRGTLKHRRGKKEMKQDRDDHFADLAEHEPTENAKKWMQRGAYSVEDCVKKMGSRIRKGVLPVDKKILIEYADMKEEIKDLRRRIAEDKKKIEQLNKITVQDSVACGKKGNKPLRTVKITGFPQREYEKREFLLEKRIAKLQMLETDLLEKQIQVEEYIEKIEKSRLRTMFRLYYIDNLTWEWWQCK